MKEGLNTLQNSENSNKIENNQVDEIKYKENEV